MRRILRSPFTWGAVALVAILVVVVALRGGTARVAIPTGTYQRLLTSGKVSTAVIHDSSDQITGTLVDGQAYTVAYPDRDTPEITAKVAAAVPDFQTSHAHSNPWLDFLLNGGLPVLLLIGLLIFFMTSMRSGGSGVMQFGKSRAKTASKDQPRVTFADVAGADEAVAELEEIKEFLESPARFQALGARIPKGVLLFGPPGTGKTLLARAVAGEAGVPFFSISGSDFVEMFVGVGASRVRDLFEQAKANSPAIVFMDEIDAVGRQRGAGLGGGHDEREQTLNQLLVEMDGFDTRGGIILIAATNRPDILDPALLRPGRFDRQIVVDRPDLSGRRRILEVHAKGKPLNGGVSLDVLARRTPGFTGADLANLLNEAALLTARRNLRQIGMRECEEAIDRVLAGPERRTLVMSDADKLVTAYHEAGHVIVGHVLPHADPIHKVSIVARSRSLGLTYTLPEDRYNHSRSQLRDAMAMCMGGRSAEELAFDEPTTGAENDIEKATRIARAMVTEYGMSDVLGPQQLTQPGGEVFLGRDLNHHTAYSQEVAAAVDAEVRSLIDEAHLRARAILTAHRSVLDRLARELVERETLDTVDLMAIIGPMDAWEGPARADKAARPVRARRPVPPAPAESTAPVPPRPRRTPLRAGAGKATTAAVVSPPPGGAKAPVRKPRSKAVPAGGEIRRPREPEPRPAPRTIAPAPSTSVGAAPPVRRGRPGAPEARDQ